MVRKFWSIRAAKDEPGVGELYLYGLIESDRWGWLAEDAVSPKQFKADLDALGDVRELRVFVNSEGGDVFAGQAIHSMLRRHKARKVMHVDGLAASIASVVVMAGDHIVMPRNAMMMVHDPETFGMGNAEELRKVAGMLDQVRESIVAAYEMRTGMDHDKLIEIMHAETWMTADEAHEMGFCHEVAEPMEMQASMVGPSLLMVNGQPVNLTHFRNAPKLAFLSAPETAPIRAGDAYTTHADSVLVAVSELERRTLDRLGSRARAGRGLSDTDLERWQRLRDAADRVLAKGAGSVDQAGSPSADALKVFLEFQRLQAHLNGAPA